MKNLFTIIILVLVIASGITKVSAEPCPTCKKIRFHYVGCEDKPIAGQKVSLKMRPKDTTLGWTLVKYYRTDIDGIINIAHPFNTDQSEYALLASKNDKISALTEINGAIAAADNVWHPENKITLAARPFKETVVEKATEQLQWSRELSDTNEKAAKNMTDTELKNILIKSVDLYDQDYKTILLDAINKGTRSQWEMYYKIIKTEMQNVFRYYYGIEDPTVDPFSKNYVMWCTAFARYVIRKGGGPDIGTFGASVAWDYFSNGGIKEGSNGEKYLINQVTMQQTIDKWNNQKIFNIYPGNIYLERVFHKAWSGHGAIIAQQQDFPYYTTIDGNASYIVSVNEKIVKPDSPDDVLQKTGVLTCVQ